MDDVKKLRQKTDARIMDCKKALDEAKGDMKKAEEIVAAKGLARADKKADRETAYGYIGNYVHTNGLIAAMVEVDCETDFVAQNEEFKAMVKNIAMHVVAMNPENVEELLDQDYVRDPEMTIANLIKALSGKIGEKMVLKRFVRYQVGE